MENENLYVNVAEVFVLLENINECNPGHGELINEIEELIIDLRWREINE